jgi:starch synthase
MPSLNILFVSAEVAPFAKTGGLGDVGAALPRHLHERGHDVRVFVPLYRRTRLAGHRFRAVEGLSNLRLEMGAHNVGVSIVTSRLPGSDLDIYFVDCPALYDRDGIYTGDPDEHLRFVALTWAALRACQHLGFSPHIAHANDWQSALLPLLLKTRFAWDEARFGGTKTLLTIHNLAHQGVFPPHAIADAGLADSAHLFHQEQLEAGVVSFLATGILYATAVSTVSPTYAREIQTDAMGAGVGHLLRERSSTVIGILNGIDEHEWDPATDPHIARRYSSDTLDDKEWNKKALLEAMGLRHRPHTPLAGIVTRLAWQKGIELVLEALPPLLARDRIQLIVLGSGATSYEQSLEALERRFRGRVCFYRGFSNPLAHMIEAGADVFLMPSRYEPCGLNQLYSLRYGTVPVVRRTGGLADSVQDYDAHSQRGTGFTFGDFSGAGLQGALGGALSVWPRRDRWRRLQQNGMRQDFTWTRQVEVYESLYRRILEMDRQ